MAESKTDTLAKRIKDVIDPGKQQVFPADQASVLKNALLPMAETTDGFITRIARIEAALNLTEPKQGGSAGVLDHVRWEARIKELNEQAGIKPSVNGVG